MPKLEALTNSDLPFRRQGRRQSVEVVRTMSKAGMLKPQRIPTVYRRDSKLITPTSPVSESKRRLQGTDGHVLSTVYERDTKSREGTNGSLDSNHGGNDVRRSLSGQESSRKNRGPKIQVTIPKRPTKNPELVAFNPATEHPALRNDVTQDTVIKDVSSVISPLTRKSSPALSQMISSKFSAITPDDLEYIDNLKIQLAWADREARTNSPESNSSDNRSSCYSISPPSSISSTSESPRPTKRRPASAYSVADPASAGVFDQDKRKSSSSRKSSTSRSRSHLADYLNKPLPSEPPRKVAPLLLKKKESADIVRKPSIAISPSRSSVADMNVLDRDFVRTKPSIMPRSSKRRVSLQEATRELESELSAISSSTPSGSSDLSSKASSDSEYHDSLDFIEEEATQKDVAIEQCGIKRTPSVSETIAHSILCQGNDNCGYCSEKASVSRRSVDVDTVSPDAANSILLRIMESIDNLDDLFSTALINQGFYITFKKHELYLIQHVLFKMSPAAWELRDVTRPMTEHINGEVQVQEHNPISYFTGYKQDAYTIARLKSLVLNHCETFLRVETVVGLANINLKTAKEIDDAFSRIWTFCSLFGSNKNREHDIIAQIDWLNGGQLAKQTRTTKLRPTSMAGDDLFAMESAFFNPPETYAQGNGSDGLSATQLYDMIEIWNCLGVLIQQLSTNVIDARANGVFQKCGQLNSSKELEVLEEWTSYVLTLGPSTILALSTSAQSCTGAAFQTANSLGLTDWNLPAFDMSRSTFMKEALTRTYNARIALMTSPVSSPSETTHRRRIVSDGHRGTRSPATRERQIALATELRLRKQALLEGSNTPPNRRATFDTERPMSTYPHIVTQLSGPPSQPSVVDPTTAPMVDTSHQRSISAPTTFNRYTPAENSSAFVDPVDLAMWTLTTELGFTQEEAIWALRKCENGERVEVDRAVDILLRQRELGHATSKSVDDWMGMRTPTTPTSSSRPSSAISIDQVVTPHQSPSLSSPKRTPTKKMSIIPTIITRRTLPGSLMIKPSKLSTSSRFSKRKTMGTTTTTNTTTNEVTPLSISSPRPLNTSTFREVTIIDSPPPATSIYGTPRSSSSSSASASDSGSGCSSRIQDPSAEILSKAAQQPKPYSQFTSLATAAISTAGEFDMSNPPFFQKPARPTFTVTGTGNEEEGVWKSNTNRQKRIELERRKTPAGFVSLPYTAAMGGQ